MRSTFITILLTGWNFVAPAQNPTTPSPAATSAPTIRKGTVAELEDATPLRFEQRVLRTSKPKEEFVVVDVRTEQKLIYLSVIDKSGTEIAVSVPAPSASPVNQLDDESSERIAKLVKDSQFIAATALLGTQAQDGHETVKVRQAIDGTRRASEAFAQAVRSHAAAPAEAERLRKNASVIPVARDRQTGQDRNAARREAERARAERFVADSQKRLEAARKTLEAYCAAVRASLGLESLANEASTSVAAGARGVYLRDTAVVPERLKASDVSPSYEETLEFINGKLKHQKLWFGKNTKKMILANQYGRAEWHYVVVFDPADANPEVRFNRGGVVDSFTVFIAATKSREAFRVVGDKQAPQNASSFALRCTNSIDAEKVAKAMRHLIELFGGKEDPF